MAELEQAIQAADTRRESPLPISIACTSSGSKVIPSVRLAIAETPLDSLASCFAQWLPNFVYFAAAKPLLIRKRALTSVRNRFPLHPRRWPSRCRPCPVTQQATKTSRLPQFEYAKLQSPSTFSYLGLPRRQPPRVRPCWQTITCWKPQSRTVPLPPLPAF